MRSAYSGFVRKPDGKRPVGRPRCRNPEKGKNVKARTNHDASVQDDGAVVSETCGLLFCITFRSKAVGFQNNSLSDETLGRLPSLQCQIELCCVQ
jgi:hypothetical protein